MASIYMIFAECAISFLIIRRIACLFFSPSLSLAVHTEQILLSYWHSNFSDTFNSLFALLRLFFVFHLNKTLLLWCLFRCFVMHFTTINHCHRVTSSELKHMDPIYLACYPLNSFRKIFAINKRTCNMQVIESDKRVRRAIFK